MFPNAGNRRYWRQFHAARHGARANHFRIRMNWMASFSRRTFDRDGFHSDREPGHHTEHKNHQIDMASGMAAYMISKAGINVDRKPEDSA